MGEALVDIDAQIAAKSFNPKIRRLMRELVDMPQVECPVRNLFSDGLYLREMTIPQYGVVAGVVHRHEHYTIVSAGRLRVETGDGVIEVQAPFTMRSEPGAQRVVYALEPSVWTTIHHNPDNIRDLELLIPLIFEAKASEMLGEQDNPQLIANKAKELEKS